MFRARLVLAATLAGSLIAGATAWSQTGHESLATELLREIVGIRSSEAFPDNTRRLLEQLGRRLVTAGFSEDDVTFVDAGRLNLVVRYRGTGQRDPLLTMAHVDVVDADAESWQADPFTLAEIDGYYYGRGTIDNKSGAVALVANFIRLRSEGYIPDRDILMVLTGNEESTMSGISYLARERRELIDADFALNTDAVGGGELDANGEPSTFRIQMAEKRYQTYELLATNPGGHSSRPRPDNAIYDLAEALVKLRGYQFPIQVSDIARESFRVSGERTGGEQGELLRAAGAETADPEALRRLAASDPLANSTMRTTCVATMLESGVAENALPRLAKATVNCRILPEVEPSHVLATLREVVANESIEVRPVQSGGTVASLASPLRDDVVEPIRELVDQLWPGTAIMPEQATFATDGLFVRNAGVPVYGVSGLFGDSGDSRAHGLDERVRIDAFHDSIEFWYRLLKRFSS
ncbi:MAG TPA: M20/M25/M40 family metallo-hydrolase [Acidobacteriota bacterium]|nr:M20/M25/M40 family metallo-hydrolase [Acidobacteriota bacterium]